jgi:hypothetical protein
MLQCFGILLASLHSYYLHWHRQCNTYKQQNVFIHVPSLALCNSFGMLCCIPDLPFAMFVLF